MMKISNNVNEIRIEDISANVEDNAEYIIRCLKNDGDLDWR